MILGESFEDLLAGLDIGAAQTFSLVLSAKNIAYRCIKDPTGWRISVRSEQFAYAKQQIEIYLKENPVKINEAFRDGPVTAKNYGMLWIALILISIHWAVGAGNEKRFFIKRLGALSEAILNGELFRCVTALTLHSDAAHLVSNLAALMLFGTILCRSTGTGAGWVLILLGGSGGNFLNALLHQSSHLSIGASTAVFSTLGSLSAVSLLKKIETSNSKIKAFLPLGGGIALLAFLGADPTTDILAHLFGFIMGCCLGMLWIWVFPKKLSPGVQWALCALSTAIVGVAWVVGLNV